MEKLPSEKQEGRHAMRRAAAIVGVFMSVLTFGVPAFADTTTDPTAGAGTGLFTTLQTYLTSNLIPAFFGLAAVGLIIGLVVKWVKKARSAS